MRTRRSLLLVAIAAGLVVRASGGVVAAQGAPTPDRMVASFERSPAESQKQLRQYQWIETTAIGLEGEERSRKQETIFYGVVTNTGHRPLSAR